MKAVIAVAVLLSAVHAEKVNPLGKVFELMNQLEAKIIKEGEHAQKTYKEYYEWCDEASANLNNDIKTGKRNQEKLTAKIDDEESAIEVATSKIEDLAAAIAKNEQELNEATKIREKEAADFAVAEHELMETVDTLDRAVSILSAEMAKNPAALAQIDTSSMSTLLQTLTTVVDAAGLSGDDQKKLQSFLQEQDDDAEPGAPAAAVYKSQSGGIVGTLEDLKDKADTELSEARKEEANSKHNYEMMRESLDDQVAFDKKTMDEEKAGKEEAEEEKATAEGDLETTNKEVKEATEQLATTNTDCMETAADYEATVHARAEEIKVIHTAEKILKESTSGAEEQTYGFLQLTASSKMRTRADMANAEVLSMVKRLAHDHHSAALAQLASRIAVVVRYGGKNGNDPFKKVKGLITEMIAKLEAEGAEEATEKAYCDEEMAKTTAKKEELQDGIEKLTSKIDKSAARSATLKDEVVVLQKELQEIAKEQAEMDSIRAEEHANYKVAKAELEEGLAGVRKALSVLRDYYGGGSSDDSMEFMQQPAKPAKFEKAEGAGGSIISILEVCESDFATNLAKEETQEADSEANYEKTTQENKVATAEKNKDVEYKTQEAAALDKHISELSADKETATTELDAVLEYDAKLKERCVAKPETYEERKARRDAEISGLKEALSILENEGAAFLQSGRKGAKTRRNQFMGA
jgi:hypothetical protein